MSIRFADLCYKFIDVGFFGPLLVNTIYLIVISLWLLSAHMSVRLSIFERIAKFSVANHRRAHVIAHRAQINLFY